MCGGGGKDPDLVGLDYFPSSTSPSSIIKQILPVHIYQENGLNLSGVSTSPRPGSLAEPEIITSDFLIESLPVNGNRTVVKDNAVEGLDEFWSTAFEVMSATAAHYKKTTVCLSVIVGLVMVFLILKCLWLCFCR